MGKLMKGDCLERLKEIPDGSVDLVVTSPPYDDLRDYGESFEGFGPAVWREILADLYHVTKEGGVVVWVVGDAVVKGGETGTSFKQALHAIDVGFRLHDTMVWAKPDAVPLTHNRYEQAFEYMFVFSKGRPATYNPIADRPNKWAGSAVHGTWRDVDGTTKRKSGHNSKKVAEFGRRHNVWSVNTEKANRTGHPAPFPIQLATDHVLSWSNPGDVVLDCFMGSGTTGVACVNTKRDFIGIELDDKYFAIAVERIKAAKEAC